MADTGLHPHATERLPLGGARRRRSFHGPVGTILQRFLSPIGIVALWYMLIETGLVSRMLLPPPLEVLEAGIFLWGTGDLQEGILISTVRAMSGLALGVTIGTVLALISGLSRFGENLIDTPVQMFRAVPVLALVPLFILWFGIGETSKILMIAMATLFPIYINLHAAIRSIDRRYFELAETAGLSRWQTLRQVVLPGSLAGWLVGLRYSSGLAWLVLVVSEQVNANSGLGYLMMDARQSFRTDIVMMGIAVYGLMGVLTDRIVNRLELWLLRWQHARK